MTELGGYCTVSFLWLLTLLVNETVVLLAPTGLETVIGEIFVAFYPYSQSNFRKCIIVS